MEYQEKNLQSRPYKQEILLLKKKKVEAAQRTYINKQRKVARYGQRYKATYRKQSSKTTTT
jgi:hypothetical protein